MGGIEGGMDSLANNQREGDEAKKGIGAIIKESLGVANVAVLGLELKYFYQNMVEQKYDALDNAFRSIRGQLSEIPEVADRLATIEAGLADKEADKYDAALRAVRELKEMIQS